MCSTLLRALLLILFCAAGATAQAQYSDLWGDLGNGWDPRGRLPDFSWAGYQNGAVQPPTPSVTHDVTDYGAVPNDGLDDTTAIQAAIDAVPVDQAGVVFLPAGNFHISYPLVIRRSNLVLRGQSQWLNGTIINVDRSLSELNLPAPTHDSAGFKTKFKAGDGGFIWVDGSIDGFVGGTKASIVDDAMRGDRTLTVDTSENLSVGQVVALRVDDDLLKSFRRHLHNEIGFEDWNHPDMPQAKSYLLSRVARIEGNLVTLDRPLRIDVRTDWNPRFVTPHMLTEVGVEKMRIHFTEEPLMLEDNDVSEDQAVLIPGDGGGLIPNWLTTCPIQVAQGGGPVCHLHEVGYNGVYMKWVADSWVRDVTVRNSDIGISLHYVTNVSSQAIRFYGRHGHHGFLFNHCNDNILDGLEGTADWRHAVTVTHFASGNVTKNIENTSHVLHLDHHRDAPFENLFMSVSSDWNYDSGGSEKYGPHSASRGTFWRLSSNMPVPDYNEWGRFQTNVIGDLDVSQNKTTNREWYEQVNGLLPVDLHQAQLERRLTLNPPTVFDEEPFYGDRDNWFERDPSRWSIDETEGDLRYALHFGDFPILDGNRFGEYTIVASEIHEHVSLKVLARTGEDLNTNEYADYGLILGWQDDLNYYAGTMNQDPQFSQIIKVVDGQKSNLTNGSTIGINDDTFHQVVFERQGDTLRLLYDGALVAEVIDGTFGAGKVGLGSNNDSVLFDTIQVHCLPQCDAPCSNDGCGGTCPGCADLGTVPDEGSDSGSPDVVSDSAHSNDPGLSEDFETISDPGFESDELNTPDLGTELDSGGGDEGGGIPDSGPTISPIPDSSGGCNVGTRGGAHFPLSLWLTLAGLIFWVRTFLLAKRI